jgi:hypothetical protein
MLDAAALGVRGLLLYRVGGEYGKYDVCLSSPRRPDLSALAR